MNSLTDRPCTCHGPRPAEQASPHPSSRGQNDHDSSHGGEHRNCSAPASIASGNNPSRNQTIGVGASAVLRLAAELLASAPDWFSFSATAGGYVVTVVPAGETCHRDGDALSAGADNSARQSAPAAVANAAGPVACQPAAGEPLPDLTRHFLSTHERLMLLELAAHPGCRAAEVREACRVEVEASRFWSLWANLQHRGLVADSPKGGFRIAGKWVSELLART